MIDINDQQWDYRVNNTFGLIFMFTGVGMMAEFVWGVAVASVSIGYAIYSLNYKDFL